MLLVVGAYCLLVASVGNYSGGLQCNGVDLLCILQNYAVLVWLPAVAEEQT